MTNPSFVAHSLRVIAIRRGGGRSPLTKRRRRRAHGVTPVGGGPPGKLRRVGGQSGPPRRRCGRWLSTGGPVDRYRYRGGSPERSVIAPSRVSSVWGLSPCTLLGKHPCDRKLFCSVTLQIKYEFFPTQLAPIASRRPEFTPLPPPVAAPIFLPLASRNILPEPAAGLPAWAAGWLTPPSTFSAAARREA